MPEHITRRTIAGLSLTLGFSALRKSLADTASFPGISIVDGDLSYPEGMLIRGDELFLVDIIREQLMIYDAENFIRKRVIAMERCGPTSIAPFGADKLLVTCHLAGALAILSGAETLQGVITTTVDGRPIPWPNDSTSDGAGGVFLSSSGLFDVNAPSTGAVVHVAPDGAAHVMVEKLHYANGVTYDPVKRELFVTEHFENKVHRFVLDEAFNIVERHVFFDLRQLPKPNVAPFAGIGPDNLRLRANGDLIVPQYGGGRFIILSRMGELKRIVDVPTQFITDTVEYKGDIFFIGAYSLDARNAKGALGRVR